MTCVWLRVLWRWRWEAEGPSAEQSHSTNTFTMWIERLEKFKCQHVNLPKDTAMLVPRTHLASEYDWRDLDIQQSGWWLVNLNLTSYFSVLTAIIQEAKEMKLRATVQPQAVHSKLFLLSRLSDSVIILLCFSQILKGCLIHCLNVLAPALLLKSSQQCHSPVRCVCSIPSRPHRLHWASVQGSVHSCYRGSMNLLLWFSCIECCIYGDLWFMSQYIGNCPFYPTNLLPVTSLIKEEFL